MPCQPGAAKIHTEILGHWAEETYNAGCFNPLSKLDDGVTPSPHAKGEAIDIGIRPDERGRGGIGQTIFEFLIANHARLGAVQLIWDGQIWTASKPYIREYLTNPHRDHIHFQLTPAAAHDPNLTALPFPGPAEIPLPPPEEEDDVNRVIYTNHPSYPGVEFLTDGVWIRGIPSQAHKQVLVDAGLLKPEHTTAKFIPAGDFKAFKIATGPPIP